MKIFKLLDKFCYFRYNEIEGKSMKLIHCSDIHLGASMRTHLSSEQAKTRQIELLATFSKMIDYAVENKISGIIIAGDLFDTDECSPKTREFLLANISQATSVEFYYLCGNHDENNVIKQGELPKNLHIFGSSWTTFSLENVKITGATLGTKNIYPELKLDENDLNIVVLHGQDDYSPYSPKEDTVFIHELENKNIDYLALGHLHTYSCKPLDKRGDYCYSGCLEGRGWDECGKKGFVLLNIENQHITHKFIPFSERTLHEFEVDVTKLPSTQDVINFINNLTCDIPSNDFVRIVLVGKVEASNSISGKLIKAKLDYKFFCFEVKDKTQIAINIEQYKADVSLAGEFVRCVEASDLPQEEKNRIINLGLKTINGEEVEL